MTWDGYLEGFHAARPGITESVLRRARGGGTDPYDWLAEVVPPQGRVLDLGCGNAPLFRTLAGRSWTGLDTSGAELAAAHSAGAGPLLRARASAIPLRDASVDVVICSMSLMVATPVPQVIAEIARVLRPGGLVAATVPAAGPLGPADRAAVAGSATGCPARPTLTSSCSRCTCLVHLLSGTGSPWGTSGSSRCSVTRCRSRCVASPLNVPEARSAA